METLEKLKSKRTIERSCVSKLISKIEVALSEDIKDVKVDELSELIETICAREQNLKDLNLKIEAQLTDLNEFDKDIASSEKYNEQIMSAKYKIKIRLSKCKAIENVLSGSNLNASDSNGVANETQIAYSAMKLPKLHIPRFSGDVTKWLEFYNTFQTSVDQNIMLSKIEKFAYLKSLLTGQAYCIVEGFALTDKNYSTCLELLKNRFGKQDLIITTHVNTLLDLEPVRNSSNLFALRKLLDICETNIRSLDNLGITSGSYGHLLRPILLKLLPRDLILEYHRKHDPKSEDQVAELINFLKCEIEFREATLMHTEVNHHKTGNNNNRYYVNHRSFNHNVRSNIPSAAAMNTFSKTYCVFCKSTEHSSKKCEFESDERKRFKLKKEGRCYRCFGKHLSAQCKVKLEPCRICNSSSHNVLFCTKSKTAENLRENKNSNHPINNDNSEVENETIVASLCEKKVELNLNNTLLQTCTVEASADNKSKIIRILCDSGSEKTFLDRKVADVLHLKPIRKERLLVFTFGQRNAWEKEFEVVTLKLTGLVDPRQSIEIEALVTDNITGANLQGYNSQDPDINKIIADSGYLLADSCQQLPIQLLLGGNFLWQIFFGETQKIKPGLFISQTIFGYTIQGQADLRGSNSVSCNRVAVMNVCQELKGFWDLESLGIVDKNESADDCRVLQDFQNSLRFSEGRYEAPLLWNELREELENNFLVAKRRFFRLENKLKQDRQLFDSYNSVIKEQLNEGILGVCDGLALDDSYYIPHRPVIKNDRDTTKLRIVYDASSKLNGPSLNDCLLPGPSLNPNILDIILKFRENKIAFSADIRAAFLQIKIKSEDQNYLRFLYFENCDIEKGIVPYKMKRVTFGVTCSPFMLAATIKHHIKQYKESKGDCVEMLDSSLYVDDLFYGAESVSKAFSLSSDAVFILGEAGFDLRKLNTNSKQLRDLWLEKGLSGIDKEKNSFKVLGLIWNVVEDGFELDVTSLLNGLEDLKVCKRSVLHTMAKIYDPAGFVSPFVLGVKHLMQEIWERGLSWDEDLPEEMVVKWKDWCSEISLLRDLRIDRFYFLGCMYGMSCGIQLHVFCDASPVAYGAVAYFRFENDSGEISTSFIMSKCRVSPLKKLTLPRLELMGALIASRLVNHLRKIFSFRTVFLWTDSQIVLSWIKGSAKNWKPFVSNRVQEIQSISNPENWNYVKSKMNPADLLTRGEKVDSLKNNELWWKAPPWLRPLPELDENGLLCLKGRLQSSQFEIREKHPWILPKHKFTELIILDAHGRVFHSGIDNTLTQVREKFWIIKGRQFIKSVLRKCMICRYYLTRPGTQMVAPLPSDRIEESEPFKVTGIDFLGPVYTKGSSNKSYVLLCTCATTRAIHLELVSNLCTETFLLAFRRFVARRGLCSTIYSDNAKTFKRADFELKTWWKIIGDPRVKEFYASHAIQWKFIVERAAWWGGFWERMVKIVKDCFRRVVRKTSLNLEELETIMIEIEAIVNSRPLTYVYNDPDEPSPLTPAHFLIGKRLTSLPSIRLSDERNFTSRKMLLKKYNYREQVLRHFWNRWHKEYLLNLRSINSFSPTREARPFKVDDVVLINEDRLPRNMWKIGRVVEVFPGRDGQVRSCKVKTKAATIKRPVQLLYPLELDDN